MTSLRGVSMAQEVEEEEEEEEEEDTLEAKFTAAVKVMQSLPDEGPFQPSDDMMLMFSSYYKQATVGPCHVSRPTGFWDTRGKAEWDAWSSLGNMTREKAMKNYIEHIQLILETFPISEEVAELVQRLGNFYTEVDVEEEGTGAVERPFTRPFAEHAAELSKSLKKPAMEGFGDLWEEIQNLQEKHGDSSVLGQGDRGVGKKNEEEEIWNNDFCANNAQITDWNQKPCFLTVDDRRWGSDTKGSSSSVAPSMSSFTNGTHSSLNSEVEEEELACSMEPGVQYNPHMHFNRFFSENHSTNPERNHRPTDSDNEEFCDSMDDLAMEERLPMSKGRSPGSGATLVKTGDVWFESSTTLKDVEDEAPAEDFCIKRNKAAPSKHSSSSSTRGRRSSRSPLRCVSADAVCVCALQSRHPITRGNANEQIAAALLRLQHKMADVLHRLHTLEELTRSQSRSPSPRQGGFLPVAQKFLRPSWWPFHLSPLAVVMAALWPLITHWLFQLYVQRRRRKIP